MFERFNQSARRAIFHARQEAGRLCSRAIDTPHLALGVVRELMKIEGLGLEEDQVQVWIEQTRKQNQQPGQSAPLSEELPVTGPVRQWFQRAEQQSRKLGHKWIDPLHFLLTWPDITPEDSGQLNPLPCHFDNVSDVLDRRVTDAGETAGFATTQVGFESKPDVAPLFLLGPGAVGRSLLDQILKTRDHHRMEFSLRLRVEAVADSRGCVSASGEELDDTDISGIIESKQKGQVFSSPATGSADVQQELAAFLVRHSHLVGQPYRSPAIVVDCSAAKTGPLMQETVLAGACFVTCNKHPLCASQELFDFISKPRPRRTRVRFESTAGAGLPLIATLTRMHQAGDRVESIKGTLSSTLGYIMTGLQQERPFSELVLEVREAGYCEPDPREDLGGRDIARKALILARTLGHRLELADVDLESLYPAGMDDLSAEQFLQRLPELDDGFRERASRAAEQDQVLRFLAVTEAGECRVGVVPVPVTSPLGRLTGTNQLVEIQSHWYSPDPLVLQGRGKGVHATAAGVLSDILDLALGP